MRSDDFNRLQETALRRELTADEHARLRAYLDAQGVDPGRWTEELALSRLLARLPDAPRPSNFTARVLRAVELDPPPRPARLAWLSAWRPPRPALRLAACLSCLVLALAAYSRFEAERQARLASSVASVVRSVEAASAAAQLPPVEILRDFDAILGFGQSRATADEDLLLALKAN